MMGAKGGKVKRKNLQVENHEVECSLRMDFDLRGLGRGHVHEYERGYNWSRSYLVINMRCDASASNRSFVS